MSYVKLFNKDFIPVGVANPNMELQNASKPLFVKLFDENLQPTGVQCVNTPAIVQNPQLSLYDLPDGVYAFGAYTGLTLPQTGFIAKVRTDGNKKYVSPILVQLQGLNNPYYYVVILGADYNFYVSPTHTYIYANDEGVSVIGECTDMFNDMLRNSFSLIVTSNTEERKELPFILDIDDNPTIVTNPSEIKVDYFFNIEEFDYPSFNGYLAFNITTSTTDPNVRNWVFKATENIDHIVTIQLVGHDNTLYVYENGSISEHIIDAPEGEDLEYIQNFVEDIFRQHYIDRGVSSVRMEETLLNVVPDSIMWAIADPMPNN